VDVDVISTFGMTQIGFDYFKISDITNLAIVIIPCLGDNKNHYLTDISMSTIN